MKKIGMLGLTISLVLLCASGVWASQTINDYPANGAFTASQFWYTGQTSGNSNTNYDVIGDYGAFATYQVTVTSAGMLKFEIVTNAPPGGFTAFGANWGTADIALDVNKSLNTNYDTTTTNAFGAITSPYELGIYMQGYATGSGSPGTATAYLVAVDTWSTTYSEVNALAGGQTLGYGGAYRIAANYGDTSNSFNSPVEDRILDGTLLDTGTVSWGPDGADGYYDVTVLFPNYTGLTGKEFSFLWATALCGNDIVYGDVDAQVPVPPSVLLLGTGLLGLVGLGYRRRKS